MKVGFSVMFRVLIKTTLDVTANLEADKIEECGDIIKIYNNNDLVGIFDIGIIQFLYKSKKN